MGKIIQICLKPLCLLSLLFTCFWTMGQDTTTQQLQVRVSKMEQLLKHIDTTLFFNADRDSNTATRNDIENNRLKGLAITDIKGISLQIGGFVQADFMHDFMDITNKDAFQTAAIVAPTNHLQNTEFSIRQSRFNFSAVGPTPFGNFFAILEFDLSGPDGTINPRTRHAWISLGKWGIGQYWSNFIDNNTWPNLIDNAGPNAAIWRRQVQLRFTQKINKHNVVAFSLEQPGSDITLPTDSITWEMRTLYPDITGSYTLSWDNDNSHIKVSALYHPISYKTSNTEARNMFGGAFNIAGNIRTFKQDAFKFQFSYGTGYARYNEDLSGMGYDAMPNAFNNYELEPIVQHYLWIFYDHFWNKKWSSTIGWGHVGIDMEDYLPPTIIASTNYAAINLLWYPSRYFKTGIEFLYGNRKNHNGEKGQDFRIQYSAFVRF